MRIYRLTDVGDSEASTPTPNPSDARRILYYLRRRSSRAASDDMIASSVFNGDRTQAQLAIGRLVRADAVRAVGG